MAPADKSRAIDAGPLLSQYTKSRADAGMDPWTHWARAEGPVPSLADFPAKGVPHCSDTTTDQIVHAKVHAKNSSTFPCPKDLTRAAASLPVRRY